MSAMFINHDRTRLLLTATKTTIGTTFKFMLSAKFSLGVYPFSPIHLSKHQLLSLRSYSFIHNQMMTLNFKLTLVILHGEIKLIQ